MIIALTFQAGTSSLAKDSVNPSKAVVGPVMSCDIYVSTGKTLTKLSSAVVGETGCSVVSAGGADVEDISALVGRSILSEELDGLEKYINRC